MNQHTQPQKLSSYPLWTALITPFNENGSVDFDCLADLAKTQANAGNGILLLGSTGEGLSLTDQEQYDIVEFVSNLKLSTAIMVAVGGFQLAKQQVWIERCNSLAIDAFLLSSPMYAKPGPVGQTQWFKALLDSAEHPCMLYNVPSRTGVEISVACLQQLQNHPQCWAMKEASGDLAKFINYRQQCTDVELFSGEDAMMPYLANAGVKGLVSVCANVWPEATLHYVHQCLAGGNESLVPVWQQAVDALFQVANPIPVKALMHLNGSINSACLRPPLAAQELPTNHDLNQVHNNVDAWLTSQHSQQRNLV